MVTRQILHSYQFIFFMGRFLSFREHSFMFLIAVTELSHSHKTYSPNLICVNAQLKSQDFEC